MLHLGTLAAILVYYRAAIWTGARRILLGADDVPPGSDASVGRPRRPAGGRRDLAADPPRSSSSRMDRGRRSRAATAAGVGFLITAAVLCWSAAWLQRPEGSKGPGRDDLARRPADRHGPDVRPAAGRQPERADDRRGAGARASRGPGPSASAC